MDKTDLLEDQFLGVTTVFQSQEAGWCGLQRWDYGFHGDNFEEVIYDEKRTTIFARHSKLNA